MLAKRIAVVRDSHERKRDKLINQMKVIDKAQRIKAREDMMNRRRTHM